MKQFDHVMIVDDESIINMATRLLMERTSFASQVSVFSWAEDALKYLQQLLDEGKPAPQLIFIDINMPQMDGWDMLGSLPPQLLASGPNAPVVLMLTSSVSEDDRQKAFRYQAVKDFVSKPLTRELLERLRLQYAPGSDN